MKDNLTVILMLFIIFLLLLSQNFLLKKQTKTMIKQNAIIIELLQPKIAIDITKDFGTPKAKK